MSPSTRVSSMPVTVTVWAVFQFAVVKVRISLLREFSVASLPVIKTVTFAVGLLSRTTVNEEAPPPSVVRRLPELSLVPV